MKSKIVVKSAVSAFKLLGQILANYMFWTG